LSKSKTYQVDGYICNKKNINEREHEGTTGKHGEIVTVDENMASDPLSKGKRRSSRRSIPHKRWELYHPG